ncbi:hypothetical protein GCM10027270_12280 [Nocardioides ginkgobilobae]
MGVADQQPAVGVDLDAERAPAGAADLLDPEAVVGHPQHRAVDGAGVDRPLVPAGCGDDDVLGAVVADGVDLERAGAGHADSLL